METIKKINPTFGKILVKIARAETTTASGIYVQDTTTKEKPIQGVIEAIGGSTNDLSVGDTVVFSKHGPDEINFGGERYFILKLEDILATIK